VIRKEALKLNRHWDTKADRTKAWFKDVVRMDEGYLSYLDKKRPSLDDQKKFANHVFRKIVLGTTVINEYFEEEVLRWAEDKEIVKGLVEKTVKSFNPEASPEISLHTLSLNWDDDKDFMEELYMQASSLDDQHKDLIARNTRNWEVERLPLTDRVILQMAIAELITFPNIPVKVTINEYIELAKNYSTPKSRQFVNGILDVIANELKDTGEVKKSGRGLIDNK
jgi:N utilization substance protein B